MTVPSRPLLRRTLQRPLWLAWCLALMCLALVWAPAARAAEDFLPPEQAFRVEAQMAAPDRAEVRVRIAPGYYLYREPLRLSAEGASLGAAEIPPGKVKFDENFQKNVETYRGELRLTVPVQAGAPFKLAVVSQGCADAGLCYPPMTTLLALDPGQVGAAGASQAGAAASSGRGWLDGDWIDRVLRSGGLWQVVGGFFLMGLLLSLTPCVLPMLPIDPPVAGRI